MHAVIRADDRGASNYSWLQSRHSFSFANYYNPKLMGFSVLRVLNDDLVAGAAGFASHGHQDMEILSYVIEGAMEHQDSAGNKFLLPAGDIQLMSAGRGIRHSEYNHSTSHRMRFLQIWITPNETGGLAKYQQKTLDKSVSRQLLVSPTGEGESLVVRQDVRVYRYYLAKEQNLQLISRGRAVYVHVISGQLMGSISSLKAGDGLAISDEVTSFNCQSEYCECLYFDMPI